jgi:hypothetical protein
MNWQVFWAAWAMAVTTHYFLVQSEDWAERLFFVLPWLLASGAAGLAVPPEQTCMALLIFTLAIAAGLPHRIYVRRRERKKEEKVRDDLSTLRSEWGQAGAILEAGAASPGGGAPAGGDKAAAALPAGAQRAD